MNIPTYQDTTPTHQNLPNTMTPKAIPSHYLTTSPHNLTISSIISATSPHRNHDLDLSRLHYTHDPCTTSPYLRPKLSHDLTILTAQYTSLYPRPKPSHGLTILKIKTISQTRHTTTRNHLVKPCSFTLDPHYLVTSPHSRPKSPHDLISSPAISPETEPVGGWRVLAPPPP